VREPGDGLDALTTGRPGAGEDHLADQARFVVRDQLGDHAAHREPEQVNLFEAEGPDERERVGRHQLDRVRRATSRGTDTAVVERDHPMLGGDAVHDPRVPVVQHCGQVGQEHHADAGLRAELAARLALDDPQSARAVSPSRRSR